MLLKDAWLLALLAACIVFIVAATTRLQLHPFIALILTALGYGILCGRMSLEQVVESVNGGFGRTVGYIGIVILAGSVIGTFLEKSGGAFRLADNVLRFIGGRNVPLAMCVIGYIVGIPVFCDSGFVVLFPVAAALSRKAHSSLAAGAIALSLGLYATHTMVPPTPGPVAAAGIIGADLGLVIMWGLVVGAAAVFAGWLFATRVAGRVHIDRDSQAGRSEPQMPACEAPSAIKSVLPIFVPIVLIVLKSVGDFPSHPFGQGPAAAVVGFTGQPIIALMMGMFLSFLLPKKLTREMLSVSGWLGQAVTAAAGIIIITGCGGAFGQVLKDSGIADVVSGYLGQVNIGIWLAFGLAAVLKTAQGSSTVAIITTASILAPLVETLGLGSPTGRAVVVVAIGAGSMVISHANDSYFWVVTGFSGMNVKQGYKLQTLGSFVQGAAAGLAVWIISIFIL